MSGGHRLYYEQHGTGRPAVVLHGGPGAGMNRDILRTFDLKKWQVLLFDQRGCGKSTPFGSLHENTTWDVVEDIERLRTWFGVDAWFVSGGSWGSTLALAYAETHPERVTGLLLRGACFCDEDAMKWLYQKGGASEVYPDAWKGFVSVLPPALQSADWKTILRYYQKRLPLQRFADAWSEWEFQISFLQPRTNTDSKQMSRVVAQLENHYFVHDSWLKKDQLLKGLSKLRHIPLTIVHGRYDMVCPISAAFLIRDALPHTVLLVTPDAGHAAEEPGTVRRLTRATRTMFRKTQKKRVRARTRRG